MCLLTFCHRAFFETVKTCSSHRKTQLGIMWDLISSETILSINGVVGGLCSSGLSFAWTNVGDIQHSSQQSSRMEPLGCIEVTLSLNDHIGFSSLPLFKGYLLNSLSTSPFLVLASALWLISDWRQCSWRKVSFLDLELILDFNHVRENAEFIISKNLICT